MLRSTVTLKMHAFGHLLPGPEAEAADRLGVMVSLRNASDDAEENVLHMTGTDGGLRAARGAAVATRFDAPGSNGVRGARRSRCRTEIA
ncbi:hypothetical protein I41_24160 [Lacipirellula limnantheis]|uniref:Uncharacterized protein n=1 Tax=Lacipirellula limnantheis TaxID=2528024 RepID=A0A517TXW5_9BACT|nr:hypothetical protein I41_24160 [Lacipirellula limnantheis]